MWFLVALIGLAAGFSPMFGMDEDGTGQAGSRDDGSQPDDDAGTDADNDSWLDGDPSGDEFVSTDAAPDDAPADPPPSPPPPPPPNEDQAQRDPWLDGWADDEYLSLDEPNVLEADQRPASAFLLRRAA